jgi:cyanophycin synthetase
VKSVVTDSVKKDGWAIFNADNEHCVKIAGNTSHCNVALFSTNENNPVIVEHCNRGGVAAVCEHGFLAIKKGDWKIRIAKTSHIPITFNGTVSFMVQNALAASLATFLWGFKTEDIRTALETFVPSAAHTPGRMNLFHFKDYKILIDNAHNPDGLRGLKGFISTLNATVKTAVISGTGDRRDEDIREVGRLCGEMFDNVVICQEKYFRGRTHDELTGLLIEGLKEANPNIDWRIIQESEEAWNYVKNKLRSGELLTILGESIKKPIDVVRKHYEKETGTTPAEFAGTEAVTS